MTPVLAAGERALMGADADIALSMRNGLPGFRIAANPKMAPGADLGVHFL